MNEKLYKIDKTSLAFSIIMPVYNVEKYVSQAIESVLSQSYRNFELIIVNDCSPDNSLSICESYAEKDKRIHIISLSQNGGLSNARNVGMQSIRGDYVLFLDSDDWWEPNLLETVSRVVEKTHPEMVFFGYADEWYSLEDKHLSTQLVFLMVQKYMEAIRRRYRYPLCSRGRVTTCTPGLPIKP